MTSGVAVTGRLVAGSRPRRRGRGDAGQLAGAEVIPLGLLVVLVGALLAANAWAVADARGAAAAAAREAARAYVEAPDATSAATAGLAAGRAALDGLGRDPDRASITFAHAGGAPWGRCTRATATASYVVPLVRLPWIGSRGDGVAIRASHSELVDPYRAGLAGPAACGP